MKDRSVTERKAVLKWKITEQRRIQKDEWRKRVSEKERNIESDRQKKRQRMIGRQMREHQENAPWQKQEADCSKRAIV